MNAPHAGQAAQARRPRNEAPVAVIGEARLGVETVHGSGILPLFKGGCADASTTTRAVIMLHGRLRDADAYLRTTLHARAVSSAHDDGTLIVAPQFLASADVAHHRADAGCLHWEWTAWMAGLDARGPAPLGSFDALDTLVGHLADRSRYPALEEIVIAGHSGGAQVAQRYAILSDAPEHCAARGIAIRFVIANPSSYAWFDGLRPRADGSLQLADRTVCPGVDDWKYGMRDLPRYGALREPAALERRYVGRDVVYLAGELDCDPAHPALDRSCAANAQGPHRLARARAYYAYLRGRHAALRHAWHEVPGAGHSAEAMFTSIQGIRALFGDNASIASEKPLAPAVSGASE
ncbi:hypothetical protein [Paraburkholderia sp. J12]|uniref:hypothetical protein n=1 Tax=Paraburkholderia sp. J12 TaxID=2805432 RepID=UPI002ABE0ED6|nr:hypothetical protein [Paraburkholderia sp. J12]